MPITRRAVALVALAFSAGSAGGQQATSPSAASNAPPCAAASYHEFDFWIGEWDVTTPDGKPAGRSSVTRILDSCVLQEEWTALGGPSRGRSFNIWDRRTRRWHQSWVDNGGMLALFDGGLRGNAMVLEQGSADPAAPRTRMTFTPLPDGRVRQHWEQSTDGGTTWSTMFDGYYARAQRRP